MGTRADFYIKKGEKLKQKDWVGSIGWDGFPRGIPTSIRKAKSEKEFREAVKKFAETRDDFTHPSEGWPWPWNNSGITDYGYIFENGKVRHRSFDHNFS